MGLEVDRKQNQIVYLDAFDRDGNPMSVAVTVVEFRGEGSDHEVTLSFDAPRDITIRRAELGGTWRPHTPKVRRT